MKFPESGHHGEEALLKIVTICQGGVVRSVGLGRLLKDRDVAGRQHDTVALSWQWNSREILEMLGAWADRVIVMEPSMVNMIPESLRPKTVVCDVGPDTYGNAQHPELMRKCLEWMNRQGL